MDISVAYVNVFVSDFDRAVDFYANTLGLALMGRLGWADTWMHFLPQILGGVLASFAFKGIYPNEK